MFTPLNYIADISVTTTVGSQAVKGGARKVRMKNLGPTNFCRVAFGPTAAIAEANSANGIHVELDEVVELGIPDGHKFIAYDADTATITLQLTYGG
jgi:hypothetical protein